MPIVLIETNVPEANIPSTFVNDVSAGVAASLGKSQDICLISVRGGANLIFGGSNDPAAFVKVMSIGRLGVEENKRHSQVISKLLEDSIGVSATRMYIQFSDVAGKDIGHNYTTIDKP